jgi:hypothetical protein
MPNSNLKRAFFISFSSWIIIFLGNGENFYLHHSITQLYSLNPVDVIYPMIALLIQNLMATSLKGVSGSKILLFTFLMTGDTIIFAQLFVRDLRFSFLAWIAIRLLLLLPSIFQLFL